MPPTFMKGRHRRDQSGGFFLHVLAIAATLGVVAVLVVSLVRTHQRNQEMHRRHALRICEDGLMVALEQLQRTPSWREGIPRTAHREGWYRVAVEERADSVPKLLVIATGRSDGVQRQQECLLALYVDNGDSVWVQQSIREQ
ncbi:MAG: hypothetical protein GF331_04445 [Chitinivibrionales bacterium]|nr:hypothetical protein [Chitinivibrionales bacterium]